MAYNKSETYDQEVTKQLMECYAKIIELTGEDVNREGLVKTPERAAFCSSLH